MKQASLRNLWLTSLFALFVLFDAAIAATPANRDAAKAKPLDGEKAPFLNEYRLARQPCTWPHRFRPCMESCERKERKYEKRHQCIINTSKNGRSTCRAKHVDTIKACKWRCYVEFCPQFKP